MKAKINLNGTGVALITPFNRDRDKTIDLKSLKKIVNHVIKGNVANK